MTITMETGIKFKLDNVILGGDNRYWNIEVTVPTEIKLEEYKQNPSSMASMELMNDVIHAAEQATGHSLFDWNVASVESFRMKPIATNAYRTSSFHD